MQDLLWALTSYSGACAIKLHTAVAHNKLVRFPLHPSVVCGLYYKTITIVIYDHNDNGQHYKTTITIVIDNPS